VAYNRFFKSSSVYRLIVFPSLQTLEVLLHIKFTDMLKEGDVTLDPAKTHMSKKDKKKLTKKQYRVRVPVLTTP
jgi:hypothetical protein